MVTMAVMLCGNNNVENKLDSASRGGERLFFLLLIVMLLVTIENTVLLPLLPAPVDDAMQSC
jgi:hypothetical protein